MSKKEHSLSGKTVIVTGGGAGIGWGITRCCALKGATVVLCQNQCLATDKKNFIEETGADIRFRQLDVRSRTEIEDFFSIFSREFNSVDALVNNAGITIHKDFFETGVDDLEALWLTNQRSVFLMSQFAARLMRESGGGSMLNISSNHGTASVPGYEMYAATKGAIAAMTRSMSQSLGKSGIRVNTLSPGLTHTEALAERISREPGILNGFNAMHPTGTYATVEQIGEIAAFLISDQASAITGAEILADHGLAAQLCRTDDLK